MTDNEAHELVLVEQLQHEEWSVVEEARGFASLMSLKDGEGAPLYTLEKCAVRIDKSENYIRELLAILDAPQELQAAVERGELAKASAAVVASIPDREQRELAGKMVLRPANKTSGPLSVLETKELIKDRFARSLQGAPFKQADALLVPEMKDIAGARVMGGACSDCPFRAGNMPAFKDDLAVSGGRGGAGGQSGINPNLCTQPKCFAKKCEAVAETVRKEALARGCELLDADQAKKIFGEDGKLKDSSGYVDIESKVDPTLFNHFDAAKVPTWKAIIKKHGKGKGITVWLAQAPSGAFVELVKWEEAVAWSTRRLSLPRVGLIRSFHLCLNFLTGHQKSRRQKLRVPRGMRGRRKRLTDWLAKWRRQRSVGLWNSWRNSAWPCVSRSRSRTRIWLRSWWSMLRNV
ncbi:ParB/RepB/Spo0J family partition protein [Verrucomicrobium spinosum]|uniref:ParB/RepB/Spo0J family partition protein n=1 Tax=Verrucomicrobium spinosum TaxID=2736 RepID=UPI000946734E|nr:hypothetical protein [Verrucomicrobium spinosum]